MSAEDSYRDAFQEEKKKLKKLSLKDKLIYIWDYYKIHILLCLFALFLIGTLIYNYTRDRKEVVLHGVHINASPNQEYREAATTGFLEHLGLDPEEYMVAYDFDLTLGSEFETGELDSNTIMKIVTLMAAAEMDYIISSESASANYSDAGKYYDLEELLPADLFEQVKDSVVYMTPTQEQADRKDEYAMVLDLSTLTNLPERYEINTEPLYLGFICNTTRGDNCVEFVRYLLELDGQ